MNLELDGEVVLITGGSKGIGLACARAFGQEGAEVVIVSRSEDNLSAAQETLAEDGIEVTTFAADLSDGAAAERAVMATEEQVGPIGVLVNSAGGVDQHTDRSYLLLGRHDRPFRRRPVRQVGRERRDLDAVFGQGFLGGGQVVLAARHDDHLGALLAEGAGAGQTDALAAAGDQDDFAVKLEVHYA